MTTQPNDYLKTFEELENEIADLTLNNDRLRKELDNVRHELEYANKTILKQREDIHTLNSCRDRQNERWAESDERLLARNSNNVKLADALMGYIQGLEAGIR